MTRVISRESVCRANDNIRRNSSVTVNMDSNNVSAKVTTIFGKREITIPREKIIAAANNVMKEK